MDGHLASDAGGASGENDHAVSERDGFGKIVRDEKSGLSGPPDDGGYVCRYGQSGLKVESAERLIQKEEIGADSHGTDQGRPLPHTA